MSDLEKEIKRLREKADLLEKLRELEKTKENENPPEVGMKTAETNEATVRAQKCAEAINIILMKYRCFFNPMVMFSGQGGFTSTVKITPILDEKVDDQMLAKMHNNGHDPQKDN